MKRQLSKKESKVQNSRKRIRAKSVRNKRDTISERVDFELLLKSAPGLYLILDRDFKIVDANNAYLKATMTKRTDILGKGLFDVFPDNPHDNKADGVMHLRASLNYVLLHKQPHIMAVQKYDIRKPDGLFEVRYWSPLNTPVLNSQGELV